MKKILLISTIFLFLFGMVSGAQALIFVGQFDKGLTPYPDDPSYDPDLSDLTSEYIDTETNLQVLIDLYNQGGGIDAPPPIIPDIESPFVGPEDLPDDWVGPLDTSGYLYVSLKYGNMVDLYYLNLGETTIDYPDNLSHYRLWNATSVPEPSTVLLLGLGLVGLAGIGRKRMKR